MNDRQSSSGFDLSRERWELIQKHLDALEALTKAEWGDYLDSACPDPEVRREVLAFHDMYVASTGHLDSITEPFVTKRADMADLSGKRIGAYRLLKSLGRGGMGVVYEAERADGTFEQRVALKLLATALTGSEAHRRFVAERRILAGLEHPAIARIIDGGVTGDGTPWFAMEHVEGLPIDAYCDRHELGIRKRLELFLQVCDAVEHAHRRLVVHRDLKPANVLVTGDGQIKLLDFGIAKLVDTDDGAPDAPHTRTAMRLMTPEYASPEQVRGEGVTTASDVYQLGLLLYELLTGHRPYVLHHRTAGELERVICEQPPIRLSAAITRGDTLNPRAPRMPASVEEICRIRSSTPKRLRRRLRGDLENIVGKALSKEPERRYGSADRLAQDVRRHLGDLPIMAQSDTMVYRARKFLQRHAMGAAAATAMIVLIGAITGVYLVQLQDAYERAESERIQAQVERDRAETEAVKAREVSDFLAGIFQSADPLQAGGTELTARELVARGAQKVDEELAGQPEVQADMLNILGRTYMSLRVLDPAEELLLRSLETRQRQLGTNHPQTAAVMSDLGWLRFLQRNYRQSRDLLEEAVAILESTLGQEAPELAVPLLYLGQSYGGLGEHRTGLEILERALSIQERASGQDSESVARVLNALGKLYRETDNLDEAEASFQRALAITKERLGPDSAAYGVVLGNLLIVREHLGKLEDIDSMYGQLIRIREHAYGPDHYAVAIALHGRGGFLVAQGRNTEAVETLERAVNIYRLTAPGHPNLASAQTILGIAEYAQGHLDIAKRHFQNSVPILENALEDGQLRIVTMINLVWLGYTEIELGNEDAAREHLTDALELWHEAPKPPTNPEFRAPVNNLSHWLAGQQRCDEAERLFEWSRSIQSPRYPAYGLPIEEVGAELARCQEE